MDQQQQRIIDALLEQLRLASKEKQELIAIIVQLCRKDDLHKNEPPSKRTRTEAAAAPDSSSLFGPFPGPSSDGSGRFVLPPKEQQQ